MEETFQFTGVVDFLFSDDPFHYETVLLAHVDPTQNFNYMPFCTMLKHIKMLRKHIDNVRSRIRKRLLNHHEKSNVHNSFKSVLIETFKERTLFDYLMNGDPCELDFLFLDLLDNFPSFSFSEVVRAYHRLQMLYSQIDGVMNKLCHGYRFCLI